MTRLTALRRLSVLARTPLASAASNVRMLDFVKSGRISRPLGAVKRGGVVQAVRAFSGGRFTILSSILVPVG
eukprot:7747709-Pyramimonas_sp.AAC.1